MPRSATGASADVDERVLDVDVAKRGSLRGVRAEAPSGSSPVAETPSAPKGSVTAVELLREPSGVVVREMVVVIPDENDKGSLETVEPSGSIPLELTVFNFLLAAEESSGRDITRG